MEEVKSNNAPTGKSTIYTTGVIVDDNNSGSSGGGGTNPDVQIDSITNLEIDSIFR